MKSMPARRPSTPPPPSVLKIPLSDALSQLTERIEAGHEFINTDVPDLASELDAMPYGRLMTTPAGTQDLQALRRKVGRWRDYNRTWLSRNLGGEAAEEY